MIPVLNLIAFLIITTALALNPLILNISLPLPNEQYKLSTCSIRSRSKLEIEIYLLLKADFVEDQHFIPSERDCFSRCKGFKSTFQEEVFGVAILNPF